MPTDKPIGKDLKAIMTSDWPAHYKLVMVTILHHLRRQPEDPLNGLAWPALRTIGTQSGISPEKAFAALQHMLHAGVVHSHGTTTDGHTMWELRLEHLGRYDPLLQTMLSTRLRTVDKLGATARHIVHELSMLADTALFVTASYRQVHSSLPWLTPGAWEWAIRQLTTADVLREKRRGNRHIGTTWQINIPKGDTALHGTRTEPDTALEPNTALALKSRAQHGTRPPSGESNTALDLPSGESNTALDLPSGESNTALDLPSGESNTALGAGSPYRNKSSKRNTSREEPPPSPTEPGGGLSLEDQINRIEESLGAKIDARWRARLDDELANRPVRAPANYAAAILRRWVGEGHDLTKPPPGPRQFDERPIKRGGLY